MGSDRDDVGRREKMLDVGMVLNLQPRVDLADFFLDLWVLGILTLFFFHSRQVGRAPSALDGSLHNLSFASSPNTPPQLPNTQHPTPLL